MFRPTPPFRDDASGADKAAVSPHVSRQRLWASIVAAASVPFGVMALLQAWGQVQPLVPMPWLWCILLAVTGWVWDRDLDAASVAATEAPERSTGTPPGGERA